jgi:hypothetical protein
MGALEPCLDDERWSHGDWRVSSLDCHRFSGWTDLTGYRT